MVSTDIKLFGVNASIPAGALALILLIPLAFVPLSQRIDILVLQLVLIAGVYIGFAVNDGRVSVVIIEVIGLAAFMAIALLALWVSPYFLIVGYIGHGLWDVAHYPEQGIPTRLARWYPLACIVYDWVFAAVIFYWIQQL